MSRLSEDTYEGYNRFEEWQRELRDRQPIETAPHDRCILGWTPNTGWKVWQWWRDEYAKKPKPCWRCYMVSAIWERAMQPVYWLPVPPTPFGEEGRAPRQG